MRRLAPRVALGSVLGIVAGLWGCGSSGDENANPIDEPSDSGYQGDQDAGKDASLATDSGFDALVVPDSTSSCSNGQSCNDGGGVCVSGSCCESKHACGSVCCGDSELCSFQRCVTPGLRCYDSSDCQSGEYCEFQLVESPDAGGSEAGAQDASPEAGGQCVGGAERREGRCLPKPPSCEEGTDAGSGQEADGGALTCLSKCEVVPTPGVFSPSLLFSWGGQAEAPHATDVMMMPIVIELDDDDCDGKVSERDIPEIVFTTFTGGNYHTAGTLHAISVVQGQVVDKWTVSPSGFGIVPAGELAAGNFDGQPGNEVVACCDDSRVRAFSGVDGAVLWTSPAGIGCRMPAIADLDQDGQPEVVVEGAILDGASGQVKNSFSAALAGNFAISDIDSDGVLDIVTSSQAYHNDGTLFIDTGLAGSWNAIGDLDKDGVPEVIGGRSGQHELVIWHYDASATGQFTIIRQGLDINGTLSPSLCPAGSAGNTRGGGPPTVADFNGDGYPDVAQAGGIGYAVFDGTKLMDSSIPNTDVFLWQKQTHDCSSAATGSSVFDFDGDGKAEVVYSDEYYLRIYEGPTGNVLWETCNTTGTLIEYPVIADVDNNGEADIVVASNSYAYACNGTRQAGVRVFGDQGGNWVRGRRVWNEHAYHITNVNEDGTIPQIEAANWLQPRLNNFRQNKQPAGEYGAPDAVVSLESSCTTAFGVIATVRNLGESALPAGLPIAIYADGSSPILLGQASTDRDLYPAEAEPLTILLPSAPQDVQHGNTAMYAVVDAPPVTHAWRECRTDNNQSAPLHFWCPGIQ